MLRRKKAAKKKAIKTLESESAQKMDSNSGSRSTLRSGMTEAERQEALLLSDKTLLKLAKKAAMEKVCLFLLGPICEEFSLGMPILTLLPGKLALETEKTI